MISVSIMILLSFASPDEPGIEPGLEQLDEQVETPSGPEPPIEAAALCGRGRIRIEDGSKEALLHGRALFELAVSLHPESGCAHAGLSRALLSLYQRHVEPADTTLQGAILEAEEAIRLSPASPETHAALSMALLSDLRPDEAADHAQTALELDPDSVPALQAAALVRMARHALASAREAAERALTLRPDLPALHLLDGNIHLLDGDPIRAIDAYRRALLMSPDFVPAAFQQAAAYEVAGDHRTAASVFKRLLEESPEEESAIIHLYMGQSLMQRQGWEAALAVLEKADFKRSKGLCNGTVLHLEATCLEKLGRNDEALSKHEEIVRDWPDATRSSIDPERLVFDSYIALGRLHLANGDREEAVRVMEEGAARPDASLDLVLVLARFYDEYRLYPEAFRLLERAVGRRVTPRNAGRLLAAYVLWARIAAKSGEPERSRAVTASLRARSEAIAGMEDFLHDMQMARAFSIAGDVDGSLDSIERAVRGGYRHLRWLAEDAEFAPIRATERYRRLLDSVDD